jgi:phage regulator Rha-like protein
MNQIEQTITSVEVAGMVGKQHNELLKDIRRYSEQLGEGKFPSPISLQRVHIRTARIS